MIQRLALTALMVLWLVPANAAEYSVTGKVVGVHDGDTITIVDEDKVQLKIRLASIDAPESAQPFSAASKKALSDMVFGKRVRVDVQGNDRYRRAIGDVYVGKKWVNLALVEQGMAWQYLQYSKDPELRAAEQRARELKLGLWQDKKPTPPWLWRKAKRTNAGR
ncbi:hypothetical protein FEM03_08105 [Phragmitibacter flavus]|uniref:TNase-like domain-containing protein n=1 Tax=Phragmitibacter flavus TaxID=2576071 RepID=A0A5R8KGW6_9BACT|nr:thermonuclease family protein [Phragmitibacter flavus]TLD71548.1 hypothetical protein FEM03_08105 [Phragmitibacter flavus]